MATVRLDERRIHTLKPRKLRIPRDLTADSYFT